MSKTSIKVENLSKQYRLGQVGTGTISHDLNRWWHQVRGKEDPYLRIGDTNDRTSKGESNYVWALKDINFEIKQGDVVGIIGKNGAGKSTLLKLLSKVTSPTTGSIKYNGRMASLLEVGTGFHPEMTGRENIYMNGTIMGMTRTEIKSKLDEIVSFAGVERYLDTPVKRYSSGMTVRLGFAIAAHLEPEILIVDEVLAVGDAEFQKKCIGKMENVANEGRTILFVSHNMATILSLCKTGILIDKGKISFSGTIESTVQGYLQQYVQETNLNLKDRKDRKGIGALRFTEIRTYNSENKLTSLFLQNESIRIELDYEIKNPDFNFNGSHFSLNILNNLGEFIIFHNSSLVSYTTNDLEIKNSRTIALTIKNLPIKAGKYRIDCDCVNSNEYIDEIENAAFIEIEEALFFNYTKPFSNGVIGVDTIWDIQ